MELKNHEKNNCFITHPANGNFLYSGNLCRNGKHPKVVYYDDFENAEQAKFDKSAPVKATRISEGDNAYILYEMDLEQAESIATYSRAANNAGRWGTEFFHCGIYTRPAITFYDSRNYEFYVDLMQINDDSTTAQPNIDFFNTSTVLSTTEKMVWTSPNAQDATAAKEVYPKMTYSAAVGQEDWHTYKMSGMSNWRIGNRTAVTNEEGTVVTYTFDGTPTTISGWHVRANTYIKNLAQAMADEKLYCGAGTGTHDAKGNYKTGQSFGTVYTFTLTHDDFKGDETLGKNGAALFNDTMTDDEKNLIKDQYIYVTDADGNFLDADGAVTTVDSERVVKEYSLAVDCSFLYSPTRIARIKEIMESYHAYGMDNFKITAEAEVYSDTVNITGQGTVSASTNPAINEVQTVTESDNTIAVNDYFGVTYTVTPAENYKIESVTYGGQDMLVEADGTFTVAPESVTVDKELEVVFASTLPVEPAINKTAAIDTNIKVGDYPAAVLYAQATSGTEGYTVQKTGAVLTDAEESKTMELVALNTDKNPLTSGFFGIRVYGKAFIGDTYYFKPFITFEDEKGTVKTIYADKEAFTLGTATE